MKMFMYTENCAVNEFVILFQDVRTLSKNKNIKLCIIFRNCQKNRGLSFHLFEFTKFTNLCDIDAEFMYDFPQRKHMSLRLCTI